jgi:hypothetical protein
MMGAYSYEELRAHIGHKIVCVCYGRDGEDPDNVAVECETCHVVLMDYDHPEMAEAKEEAWNSHSGSLG